MPQNKIEKMRDAPNLYNIPAGAPFLQALAAGLVDKQIFPEFTLADMRILLPTRRAARELTNIFLTLANQSGRAALLLPRIDTLGDINNDEDELNISDELITAADVTPLIKTINPRQRHFYLMQLITKWETRKQQDATTPLPPSSRADSILAPSSRADSILAPSSRAALAETLAQLLDTAYHEQIDWNKLESLVPDALAENWQDSLSFLRIITSHWQDILHERGLTDIAAAHNSATRNLAQAWRSNPPTTPIIAAGSTGSNKAVGELLATIAHLPHGAVVLAGLDMDSASKDFARIRRDATHPQTALANLLCQIVPETKKDLREIVKTWTPEIITANQKARIKKLTAALVPAELTADWQAQKSIATIAPAASDNAFVDFSVLTAPDQAQEAGCIALAMRQVLEQSETETAALITRDRNLARRVAATLARWGVSVDDSAGTKLTLAPPALLLRLVLEAKATNFSPVALLALLKHPLVAKNNREQHLASVRELEKYALRGAYSPAKNLETLCARLNKKLATKCENKKTIAAIEILLKNLDRAFAPMLAPNLAQNKPAPLREHLQALCATAALLCDFSDSATKAAGENILFNGNGGKTLFNFLETLYTYAPEASLLSAPPDLGENYTHSDWQGLFNYWLSREVVREQQHKHSRLFIWGPLEARLLSSDLVIVGGLNEGSFPPIAESGAWLSRGMRARLGFSEPERAIGRAAHDFVAAAAAPKVLLTRAAKIDGTPAVEARWLRRLRALYGASLSQGAAQTLLAWWQQLDNATSSETSPTIISAPISAPSPTPPLAARPKRLSVTQIETLILSPYNIYARKILNLPEWEAIEAPQGAAERGSFLHRVLEIMIKTSPPAERTDAAVIKQKFMEIASAEAANMDATSGGGAEILLFWQARLAAIAQWVGSFEARRAPELAASFTEQKGEWVLPIAGETFTLSAKADRIDIYKNGGLALLDYKSGAPPSAKDIKTFYSVQMSLQAAMLADGAFKEINAPNNKALHQLAYIRLNGKTPAGEMVEIDFGGSELQNGAVAMLTDLLTAYQNPHQAYLAATHNTPYASGYDHLARRAEWMSQDIREASDE